MMIFSFPMLGYCCSPGWDMEYWQSVNWTNWEWDKWALYTSGAVRLNHGVSRPYYYRLSGNVAYQWLSWLDLEAHYSYISSKDRGESRFMHKNRLEIEINPSMKFCENVSVDWRNRIEFIKKQDDSKWQYDFRHRTLVTWELARGWKLVSVQFGDEIFYDLSSKEFSENRFYPLIANFNLSKRTTLDVYVMIRNFLSSNRWYKSVVVGSEFAF